MMWNRSQRFGLPAGIATVAVLAIGVLGSVHEAQANAGGAFDLPSQGLESVQIEAPALGNVVEVDIPTHAPVMLAQAQTSESTESAGEEMVEKIEQVGTYAVQLYFDDNHDTGIYSWQTLYDLGVNKDAYWQDYLQRLVEAGHTRKEPGQTH